MPSSPAKSKEAQPMRSKRSKHPNPIYPVLYNSKQGSIFEVNEYEKQATPIEPLSTTRYCICFSTSVDYNPCSYMVQCSLCERWFHLTCLGLSFQWIKSIEHYFCRVCQKRYMFDLKYPVDQQNNGKKVERFQLFEIFSKGKEWKVDIEIKQILEKVGKEVEEFESKANEAENEKEVVESLQMAQGMPYDCKLLEEELLKKLYELDCKSLIDEMDGWKIEMMQEIIGKVQWKDCENYLTVKNKYEQVMAWKRELDIQKEQPVLVIEAIENAFEQAQANELNCIDLVQIEEKEWNSFKEWEKKFILATSYFSKKMGIQKFVDLMVEKKKYNYNSVYSNKVLHIIQNTIDFSKKVQAFVVNSQEGKTTEGDAQTLIQEALKLEIQVPIVEIIEQSKQKYEMKVQQQDMQHKKSNEL